MKQKVKSILNGIESCFIDLQYFVKGRSDDLSYSLLAGLSKRNVGREEVLGEKGLAKEDSETREVLTDAFYLTDLPSLIINWSIRGLRIGFDLLYKKELDHIDCCVRLFHEHYLLHMVKDYYYIVHHESRALIVFF
jgi:hypothetical protein